MKQWGIDQVSDRSDQTGTATDLARVTPDLVGGVEWSVGHNPLSSKHLPITINITGGTALLCIMPCIKFLVVVKHTGIFPSLLGALPIGDYGAISIESLNSFIPENILFVARASIPTTKKGSTWTHNNPWWSNAYQEAVKNKRYYYKKYRPNCTLTKAKTERKKSIAQAKLYIYVFWGEIWTIGLTWATFIKRLRRLNSSTVPPISTLGWGTECLKLIKQRQTPSQRCSPMLAALTTSPRACRSIETPMKNKIRSRILLRQTCL